MNECAVYNELPLLSENEVNSDIFNKFIKVVDLISSEYKGKVLGLWYLPFKTEDDELCLLSRTILKKGTIEYINMNSRICDIFENIPIMIYDYDTNIKEEKFGNFITKRMDEARIIYVYKTR